MSWACPRCDRTFRQVNQRHACGVGSAATLLKGRPPVLTDLYRKLETTVRSFGEVEVVTRDRYALFRTTRIFADLTVTRDALRLVVHLGRKVSEPYFIKVGASGKRVSHVVLVRTARDLRTVIPFTPEGLATSTSRFGTNRHNPYFAPRALDQLASGLSAIDCRNTGNISPPGTQAPPCKLQPPINFRSRRTQFPQVKRDR